MANPKMGDPILFNSARVDPTTGQEVFYLRPGWYIEPSTEDSTRHVIGVLDNFPHWSGQLPGVHIEIAPKGVEGQTGTWFVAGETPPPPNGDPAPTA